MTAMQLVFLECPAVVGYVTLLDAPKYVFSDLT